MNANRITITLSVTDEGIFPNADDGNGSFVCGVAQPTVAMALASIDDFVRDYIGRAQLAVISAVSSADTGAFSQFPGGGTINGAPTREMPIRGTNETETQIWITGLGWIPRSVVTCSKCGDAGRIVTDWADGGDPENGPMIVGTAWEYCTCSAGDREREQDRQDDETAFESYTRAYSA